MKSARTQIHQCRKRRQTETQTHNRTHTGYNVWGPLHPHLHIIHGHHPFAFVSLEQCSMTNHLCTITPWLVQSTADTFSSSSSPSSSPSPIWSEITFLSITLRFAYIESSGCQKVVFRVDPCQIRLCKFFLQKKMCGLVKCAPAHQCQIRPSGDLAPYVFLGGRTPIVLRFAEIKIPTTYWGDQGWALTYCQDQGCFGFLCCSTGLLLCSFRNNLWQACYLS